MNILVLTLISALALTGSVRPPDATVFKNHLQTATIKCAAKEAGQKELEREGWHIATNGETLNDNLPIAIMVNPHSRQVMLIKQLPNNLVCVVAQFRASGHGDH